MTASLTRRVTFAAAHRYHREKRRHGEGVELDGAEVREGQLDLDRFNISSCIDRSINMDDVLVLKTAHDLNHRIGFANAREKLVTESFAFGGARDEPREARGSGCEAR